MTCGLIDCAASAIRQLAAVSVCGTTWHPRKAKTEDGAQQDWRTQTTGPEVAHVKNCGKPAELARERRTPRPPGVRPREEHSRNETV